jgi:CHAT domain-containing protein
MLWPISDEVTVQIMKDFYEAAHNSGNAPEALAEVQRDWLVKLRTDGLRWIRREEREIVARNDGQRRFPLRLSAGRSRSALWQFL